MMDYKPNSTPLSAKSQLSSTDVLSGHSDTKLVMRGITHGACDYLLKPVRKEELKNIWQHVIRKKVLSNCGNSEKHRQRRSDNGQTDQIGNLNGKRKDQVEDDYEESEDGQENEEPSTQKKARVVWSMELHRKFVDAVNQLGVEKAVPKKILDLMNVEGISRENVASHLQKYRLYLKRVDSVNNEGNMTATLLGRDASSLRVGSFDGLGDFHAFTGSSQLPNAALGSYSPGAVLGRLNTPALFLRGLSSGAVQPGHAPNSSSSISDLVNMQSVILPGNQNVNVLTGMPPFMEHNQLQVNMGTPHAGEFSSVVGDSSLYPQTTSFLNAGTTMGSSSNPFLNPSSNPLLLQGQPQQAHYQGNLKSHSSVTSLNSGFFETGVGVTTQFPHHGRGNENGHGTVPMSGFPSNSLPLSDPFNQVILPHNFGSMGNGFGGITPTMQNFGQEMAVCNEKRDAALINQSNSNTPFMMQQGEFEKLPLETSVRLNVEHNFDETKSQSGLVTNMSGSLDNLMNAMVKQEQGEVLIDGGMGWNIYPIRTCM